MTIDSIYNAKILEYAGNIGRVGRLEFPDGTAKAHSKLCGSTVIVDIKIADGFIADYAADVKACALGQASSAIMAKNVLGCNLAELEKVYEEMRAMLEGEGGVPSGKFAELKFLEPVKNYKARHASTLLVFQAVIGAVKMALEKRNEK